MTILAIDLGTKRHGTAVSDGLGISARPLECVPAEDEAEALARLSALAAEWGAEEIVIGLPINMDGTEGPAAKSARALGEKIAAATNLPVHCWDERLTTEEAERQLRDEGRSIRQSKQLVDSRSAQVILQSYLEGRK